MKDIVEIINAMFPSTQVYLIDKVITVHSEIYIFSIKYPDKRLENKLFVKFCKDSSSEKVIMEFKNQSLFYEKINCEHIRTPKPLKIDLENKLVIMEFVNGIELKKILLKYKYIDKQELDKLIKLSALMLARYHSLFSIGSDKPFVINNPDLKRELSFDYINNCVPVDKCLIDSKVRLFNDYTVWNIIVDKNFNIYLVDFPGEECVFTPHLDLARFKYSLNIVKQYPQFRFLRRNWWNVEELFSTFLQQYCYATNKKFNNYDLLLINFFEKEYLIKLKDVYDSDNKFFFEKIYMSSFINKYITRIKSK